jgi:hypothetical protein
MRAMTVRTVRCKLCCDKPVPKDQIPFHSCIKQYKDWRRPFLPERTRIAFVGYAPPVPVPRTSVVYIYKDPESRLANTSLRLRKVLWAAFRSKPRLLSRFPALDDYFRRDDTLKKGPFLKALKASEVEWVDTVDFPIETGRVRELLKDPEFVQRFGRELGSRDYDLAIFVSNKQEKLERIFREAVIERGRVPMSAVLAGNLWMMSVEEAGETIGRALEKTALEQRHGMRR